MKEKHMGVAEVKRNFADVIGQVVHGKQRIIVKRRGRPVVAIVPLEQAREDKRPGQRLAAAIGCAGEDGAAFQELMAQVVAKRRRRLPRPLAQDGG